MKGKVIDLKGQVFGKLTVLELSNKRKDRYVYWKCQCICGTQKLILGYHLRKGSTLSCGCLRKELASKRCFNNPPGWRGGKTKINGYQYIKNPDHPNAWKKGYVAEHILVMSKRLGRPLTKNETVHHKNGVRDDNEPENLELWVSNHPAGQFVEDLIFHSIKILNKYHMFLTPNQKKELCANLPIS